MIIDMIDNGAEWPDASAKVFIANNLTDAEKAWVTEAYDSGVWNA